MKSKPPVLKGLYRIGNDFAWKITSPQDHEHEYVFFGSNFEAKKIGIKPSADNGVRPRVRLLGSV